MASIAHIQKQLRELTQNPPAGFRVEADKDIYTWIVWFTGPKDSLYEGGQYKAQMTFPKEFPMEPPTFRILSTFWHPNVYNDARRNGEVCISILHPPGTDEMNEIETAMMRWTPVQTIRSVLISIISLLSDPDPKDAGAPANVDALAQFRNDRKAYTARCRDNAEKSLRELPEDFEAPNTEERPEVTVHATYTGYTMGVDDDDDFAVVDVPRPQGIERYRDQLEELRGYGVETDLNDDQLLQLIADCRGDLGEVLDHL